MGSASRSAKRAVGAVAASAALLVGAVPAAHATYPGSPGVIVFPVFANGQADLWSADPSGAGVTRLTDTPDAIDLCPAVSADGRRLASCRNAGDGFEIWTSEIGGGGDRQLTDLGGWAIFPDWNPRGNRIVFSWSSEPDTDTGLYVVHARSGRIKPLLVERGYSLGDPVWSPDGRKVLYTRTRNELDAEGFPYPVEAQLWTVDVRSGVTTQLTSDPSIKDLTSDWSPDGSRIVFGAEGDLWLMDADGSNRQNLTSTADGFEWGPSFSPDGRSVAFTGPVGDGPPQVQVIDVDGSDRRVVAPNPDQRQLVPAWQPVTPRTK
jgi:Tol biopolymer transport system component